MPGLIGLGDNYREQSESLAGAAANTEAERNYQNKQIKAAQMQKIGSAVGMGAAIGMSGGPVGALVGTGIGYAVGRIF